MASTTSNYSGPASTDATGAVGIKPFVVGVQGGSGKLGQAILAELLRLSAGAITTTDSSSSSGGGAAAFRIVAVTRTPDKVPAGVEARLGDFGRPETLAAAYAGIDRLVVIPGGQIENAGAARAEAIRIAAVVARVGHVVYISGVGTHNEAEPGLAARHWVAEQALIRHAAHWTVLRMSYFAESYFRDVQSALASGRLVGFGDSLISLVSRDDLAHATAALLACPDIARHDGFIYNATGPELLSGPERAAIISELAGKPVNFAVVTKEQLTEQLKGAGIPPPFIGLLVQIHEQYVQGVYDILSHDLERLMGRPARSFRTLLAAMLKGEHPTA